MMGGDKPDVTNCPHCNSDLLPWRTPDMTTWGSDRMYICFNDDCPYFVEGWAWMKEQYNQDASYRFRFNPENGECGPIPVWSQDALKPGIIRE